MGYPDQVIYIGLLPTVNNVIPQSSSWFYRAKIRGSYVVMAYLLAEVQHGSEHHRARDGETTCASMSLQASPGFNHEA